MVQSRNIIARKDFSSQKEIESRWGKKRK
jgi:hypothetical protein